MSKAVLLSIRPKWCELIASGEKTIEVRKTRPRIETPFNCFIYCTKPKYECEDFLTFNAGTEKAFSYFGGGMVVGEFICDQIFHISYEENGPFSEERGGGYSEKYSSIGYKDGLTDDEFDEYLHGRPGYGWHISALKMYDKPLELSEFNQCHKCEYYSGCKEHEYGCDGAYKVQRPPQSWMHVEELI